MSEVDVLVERIEAALDSRATSGQALTAQDVCQAEFTTVWGGYDPRIVDNALESYALRLDAATGESG
jgi:DivIVA domain-containing protein